MQLQTNFNTDLLITTPSRTMTDPHASSSSSSKPKATNWKVIALAVGVVGGAFMAYFLTSFIRRHVKRRQQRPQRNGGATLPMHADNAQPIELQNRRDWVERVRPWFTLHDPRPVVVIREPPRALVRVRPEYDMRHPHNECADTLPRYEHDKRPPTYRSRPPSYRSRKDDDRLEGPTD